MQEVKKIHEKTISGARFANKTIMDALRTVKQKKTRLSESMERNDGEGDKRDKAYFEAAVDLYKEVLSYFSS